MLHGMGEPIERAVGGPGRRVRVYTPYGAMLPGMAYLVRRLLENTSNESFLKASFAGGAEAEALCADPEEVGAMIFAKRRKPTPAPGPAPLPPFANEPLTDFTRPEARDGDDRGDRSVRGGRGGGDPLPLRGRNRGWGPRSARESGKSLPGRSLDGLQPDEPGRTGRRRSGRRGPPGLRDLVGDTAPRPGRVLLRAAAILRATVRAGRRRGLTSAASPGARPTATSPRRSTSASSTPGR